MKRLLGKLSVGLAIVSAVALMGQTSAYATHAAGAGTVTGQGTISPGLTLTPTNQSVTFGGTLAGTFSVGGTTVAGTMTCLFSGGGAGETDLLGGGSVSGSCSPGAQVGGVASANCTLLTYVRVGATVVVRADFTCTVVVNSASVFVRVVGAFVFVPTSANPVTSYLLAGDVAAADV